MIDMKFYIWVNTSLDEYVKFISIKKIGEADFVIDAKEVKVLDDAGHYCITLGNELHALVMWGN